MPAAWPLLAPLVEPILGTPYAEMDCWGVLQHLLKAGWDLDLTHDPDILSREVVEVWFQGDPHPPLGLCQPWDCLVVCVHGVVGDHCGLVMEGTQFVHTSRKAGVIIDRLQRWESRVLQIARLRRLV
jgi:hypothetical protein